MSVYTDKLKQLVDSIVKSNNNQEITGQLLQKALNAMIDATEETYQLVDALKIGGIALLQQLGDSTTMGISQKVITEYLTSLQNQINAETQRAQAAEQDLHNYTDTTRAELQAETARATEKENNLQAQIDAIVSKDATVNLAASPATIFVGTATDIALTATTNTDATDITIKRGEDTLATGSGKMLSHTDPAVTLDAPGSVAYSADFTISGLHRSTNKSVTAVYPIFYGAQADFDAESLTQYATPTTAVARAYTVQLNSTRRKFFLRVPKQGVAQVKSVVMGSGSEASPVSGGIVASLSDENYNVWASDDGFTGNGPQVFTVS